MNVEYPGSVQWKQAAVFREMMRILTWLCLYLVWCPGLTVLTESSQFEPA